MIVFYLMYCMVIVWTIAKLPLINMDAAWNLMINIRAMIARLERWIDERNDDE